MRKLRPFTLRETVGVAKTQKSQVAALVLEIAPWADLWCTYTMWW